MSFTAPKGLESYTHRVYATLQVGDNCSCGEDAMIQGVRKYMAHTVLTLVGISTAMDYG